MKIIYLFAGMFLVAVWCSFIPKNTTGPAKLTFPYKQAGLSERQAAAHLLNRFTYGIKPGDIDKVIKIGLEKWFQQQLIGNIKDDVLNKQLSRYDDINLSNSEVKNKYPRNAQILRMAIADGSINKDSLNKGNGKEYRKQLQVYMQKKGFKPQQELFRQLLSQKILRATYTNNQLHELLTDFWFNHFNVSLTKNQSAAFIPAYERDVIRPNVAGKFQTLLLATAKSPAMLTFLDNSTSSAQPILKPGEDMGLKNKFQRSKKMRRKDKQGGLNENYAREVMELHTLGVDGGYTQDDVTQAARVLTGWTVTPTGDFLFKPTRHDHAEKIVLGRHFQADGGYEEGVDLLMMLAHHPATAGFISKKLATRFVNDHPSSTLVNEMANTFTKSDGDIKQVMIALVTSPEFWSPDALREKTKSPFELAISAVRSLNAEVTQPYQLNVWISKMGQKMYYYQAPTGFPDQGQYWINTGSLLNRMNFGLALASQRITGLKLNLPTLNRNQEPESADAALLAYCKIILPERNLVETIKRLKPMLNDPALASKVEDAIQVNPDKTKPNEFKSLGNNPMLAQIVGVIIGSPEFQRK